MKKALIFLGITAVVNIAFRLIGRSSQAFSEWYAANVYPLISGSLARITGLVPIAVAEILLYIVITLILLGVVLFIVKLVKLKGRRLRVLLVSLLTLSCTVSAFMAVYWFNCGINYNRKTFTEHSGLSVEFYDKDDLLMVIAEVNGELYRIIPYIETAEDGHFVMDKSKLNVTATNSMSRLGEVYPVLDVYYPRPKPLILSKQIFTPTFTCGIFSPFTMEAVYNYDMPHSQTPFTISHELSHLAGFMREDEANFIAFLACRGSGDVDFMYSGYINALVYLMNAFYAEAEPEEYAEVLMWVPEQVRAEFDYTKDYWHPPASSELSAAVNDFVSSAASTVNDAYLKSQGQTDGVKSYGRLVDLLIADYFARHSNY